MDWQVVCSLVSMKHTLPVSFHSVIIRPACLFCASVEGAVCVAEAARLVVARFEDDVCSLSNIIDLV